MGKITANLCFKYINIVYHEQRHYRTQKWLYVAFLLVLLTIYCCSLWGGPIFCSDERSGKESSSLKYMCNGVSVIFTDGCNNIVSSETPRNVALCVSLEFIWISYCFFSQGWLHHLPWLVHHLLATCWHKGRSPGNPSVHVPSPSSFGPAHGFWWLVLGSGGSHTAVSRGTQPAAHTRHACQGNGFELSNCPVLPHWEVPRVCVLRRHMHRVFQSEESA